MTQSNYNNVKTTSETIKDLKKYKETVFNLIMSGITVEVCMHLDI
jgi:hypothetical protein